MTTIKALRRRVKEAEEALAAARKELDDAEHDLEAVEPFLRQIAGYSYFPLEARVACDFLDYNLGSGQDPIWVDGEETMPTDLEGTLPYGAEAKDVRVTYWNSNRNRCNGTLLGLLRDRLGALPEDEQQEALRDFVASQPA